jgi:hypothetical protein
MREPRPYRRRRGSTVVGDLRVLSRVGDTEVLPVRDILVHVPTGAHESGHRYPVLYMHDGLNLFDASTSLNGEWQVDETLTELAADGLELIVVGIPSAGDRRLVEYTPYAGERGRFRGGAGSAYLRFVVDTVKPAVDAAFPTQADRRSTGIMGSSLGGLISLWAAVEHGATFGLIGSMSTAIPAGQGFICPRLRRLSVLPERVYVDIGGHEGSHAPTEALARRWSAEELRTADRVRTALTAAGLREPRSLKFIEDPEGIHHEVAWARRLPVALRFLFGPPAA